MRITAKVIRNKSELTCLSHPCDGTLKSLVESINAVRQEINSILTEMVETEKSLGAMSDKNNFDDENGDGDDDDDEDISIEDTAVVSYKDPGCGKRKKDFLNNDKSKKK